MKTKLFMFLAFAACTLILPKVAVAAINDQIIVMLEEPATNSVYSGVANIRGWAVAPAGIARIELRIDGTFLTDIPTGGHRSDVGSQFPGYPNADQSGFSMAFNYSNLADGPHTIAIRAVDDNGDIMDTGTTFGVTGFDNPFVADPTEVSLQDANIADDGNRTIVINNLLVDGRHYAVQLSWRTATQGFAITRIDRVQ